MMRISRRASSVARAVVDLSKKRAPSTASTSARIGGGGVEVKESRELVNRLPTLDPFDNLHYSFPTLDETFPSLDVDFSASVRLHFAVATDASAKRAGRATTTTTLREDEPEYDGGRFASSSLSNPHLRNEADGEEEAKETGDPSSDLGEEISAFLVFV